VSEEEGARFGSTDVGSGAPDAAPGMPEAARACAWCGTPATPEATTCASCGAALAQRESIGDLAISGLTAVDAALQDFDKRPLHLRGPSPSQGMAPALIVGAMAGGPIGLAAIGGVAAVAAAEYLGASRGGSGAALENVGKPSEVVLRALENLEADAARPSDSPETTPAEAQDSSAAAIDPADDGRSIWRDLPPVPPTFDALDDREQQKEEGVADGR
jgi:hypothetical protein